MLFLDRQGSACAISVVADLGGSLDPEDPGLPLSEHRGWGEEQSVPIYKLRALPSRARRSRSGKALTEHLR